MDLFEITIRLGALRSHSVRDKSTVLIVYSLLIFIKGGDGPILQEVTIDSRSTLNSNPLNYHKLGNMQCPQSSLPLWSRSEIMPEVMKTGSTNLTFCVTFHNFFCQILACLPCCSRVMSFLSSSFIFSCFLVRNCVEVDVDIITHPPHPSPPLCFCPYPQFSL